MAETPTSPTAIAAAKLRTIVSRSATFQSAGGHADEDEAIERVFLRDAREKDAISRPFAVIAVADPILGYRLVAGGSDNFLRPHGSLFLFLTIDTPPDYHDDTVNAEWAAGNFFGNVISDIAELAGEDLGVAFDDGSGDLSIIGIECQMFDENSDESQVDLGRFYYSGWRIDWGDG